MKPILIIGIVLIVLARHGRNVPIPFGPYLAAAGVGRIGIVDSDRVDLSNLQRQIIHDTSSVGRDKTFSAAERLKALNPESMEHPDPSLSTKMETRFPSKVHFLIVPSQQPLIKYFFNLNFYCYIFSSSDIYHL